MSASSQPKFTMADDPIGIIIKTSLRLVRFRPFRVLLHLVAALNITSTLIYFGELLVTFDTSLLIKYAPMMCIFCQGVLGYVVPMTFNHILQDTCDAIYSKGWSLQASCGKTGNRIRKEGRILLALVKLNAASVLTAGLMHCVNAYYEKDIYYPLMMVKRAFDGGVVREFFCWCYIASMPVLAYLMIYLLNDFINSVSKESTDKVENFLIGCQSYQDIIKERLKICIKQHVMLKRVEMKFNQAIIVPLLACLFLGLLFHVSLVFNLIVLAQRENFTVMGVTLFASTFNIAIFFYAGQTLIDESSKLSDNAFNCAWTGWNLRNRKLLLIFMTNLQEPAIIGVKNILVGDYQFLIKMFQLMVSTCTFFDQVVNRQ